MEWVVPVMREWYLGDRLYVRERRPEIKKDPIICEIFVAAREHNYNKIVNCRVMFNKLLEAYRLAEGPIAEILLEGLIAGGYNDAMFDRWKSEYD